MSYSEAMEAAGAVIHDFESFGSYQGNWWAKVSFEGRTFWVAGAFGSCSGCDAFEAEFGYSDHDSCENHRWDRQDSCEACKLAQATYNNKLAEFGRGYLTSGMTQQEAEAHAGQYAVWGGEDKEQLLYLQAHPIGV